MQLIVMVIWSGHQGLELIGHNEMGVDVVLDQTVTKTNKYGATFLIRFVRKMHNC